MKIKISVYGEPKAQPRHRHFQRGKFKIIIPGNPIPKARPRFARRGKFVTTYDIQKIKKEQIQLLVCQQFKKYSSMQLLGPICVEIKFHMLRPKSHYGIGRNLGKLKKKASFYHIKKPDIDNLTKWVYDVFNNIVWKDDAQVIFEKVKKQYSEKPRTEIYIEEINEKSDNKSNK